MAIFSYGVLHPLILVLMRLNVCYERKNKPIAVASLMLTYITCLIEFIANSTFYLEGDYLFYALVLVSNLFYTHNIGG